MLETITEKSQPGIQSKKNAEAPPPLVLADHFQRFLKYWTGAELDDHGPAPASGSTLPVELIVRLQGTVPGTLVLSCTPDFQKWLFSKRDYKTIHLTTSLQILVEMTTLYCVYLIQQFWLSEHFELGPLLPRTSTRDQWPAREPNSTCRVRAGQYPVEIRLWID